METKDQIRQQVRKARQSHLLSHSLLEESEKLTKRLLASDLIQRSNIIGGYWPTQSEVDCRPLLQTLVTKGHTCGLPVVIQKDAPLIFREWRPGYRMVSDLYSILVPHESYLEIHPTILLVPLIAFDKEGNRLGQGAGCYDRTLAFLRQSTHITAIGFAFDCQEVERVPVDAGDQPLDYVVTPTRLMKFSKGLK